MVGIKIDVEELVKQKYTYSFEREIKSALTVVPSDHLRQLSKIIVQYEARKHNLKALGSYYGKSDTLRDPYIIIYAKNLLARFPHKIPLLSKFCFKLYLRDVLYHEIAHHYQRISHGFDKESWEKHADSYSRYMQIKKYKMNPIGNVIFGSVYFFRRFLKKFKETGKH